MATISEDIKKYTKLVENELMTDDGVDTQKVDKFANKLDSELEWFIETSRLFSEG
jgi:hypothetical protein